MVEADKANAANLLYFGGDGTVTTANGFGELIGGEAITFHGPAAVWCIASAVSQNVRVIEGLK